MMAEFLGWVHATVVVGVEAAADGKSLKARRELEGGINETVELPAPAVLTIQFGINQPRYASLKGIMAAKKKNFKVWMAADLGLADAAADLRKLLGDRDPDVVRAAALGLAKLADKGSIEALKGALTRFDWPETRRDSKSSCRCECSKSG